MKKSLFPVKKSIFPMKIQILRGTTLAKKVRADLSALAFWSMSLVTFLAFLGGFFDGFGVVLGVFEGFLGV
jgi:hypothetical protein